MTRQGHMQAEPLHKAVETVVEVAIGPTEHLLINLSVNERCEMEADLSLRCSVLLLC